MKAQIKISTEESRQNDSNSLHPTGPQLSSDENEKSRGGFEFKTEKII